MSWADPLVDELDAKQRGRSLNNRQPGSFFLRQKNWMQSKQGRKGQGKSQGKGSGKSGQRKGKGKEQGKPRAAQAAPGGNGEEN